MDDSQEPLLASSTSNTPTHHHGHHNHDHDAPHHHGTAHHHDAAHDQALRDIHALDLRLTTILKSWAAQGSMAWPTLLQMIAVYSLNVISLGFAGHLGKSELAAAALGTSFVSILGRMIISGLNGALDTLASQAAGSGDRGNLPMLYQRSVLFLWLHAIPLTGILIYVPKLMNKGTDTQLASQAFQYLLLLIPLIWIECVYRPLNSVLYAQRITRPQMVISVAMVPAHFSFNYLLIHQLRWGYLGAAAATVCSSLCTLLLLGLFLAVSGQLSRVWTPITGAVFKGWRGHAALAYPACIMRCAEGLGFSLMTLLSGLLPDPDTAVSAASIAFNLYGILYMGFTSFSISTMTFVGNALGTGNARQARVSAITSILFAPALWLLVGGLLLEPHSQRALALLFTDGSDPELMRHLHRILNIVAMLELFDGTQTIMTGVITGCGKQKHGVVVNIVAFYVVAIPTALVLGFWAKQGVEGMYVGMLLGPVTQVIWYLGVILRMDWPKEAARAQARLQGAGGK